MSGPVSHRLSTRAWHWINAVTLLVLLMSGLMIFNAHPRLYWGEYGANVDYAWLEIGQQAGQGYLRVGSMQIGTDGWLGTWADPDGRRHARAFPWWATIPSTYSLADGRLWHLAFAWVLALGLLAYLVWSLVNGHLRRDIHISAREWRWSSIWRDIRDHLRLRFAADGYGVLQKLSYALVLFGLLPAMIVTGLAMSPASDAWVPWLTHLFGGRQSARSLHFLFAWGLVGFTLVHVVLVVLSGPLDQMRGMITGRRREHAA